MTRTELIVALLPHVPANERSSITRLTTAVNKLADGILGTPPIATSTTQAELLKQLARSQPGAPEVNQGNVIITVDLPDNGIAAIHMTAATLDKLRK